MITISKLLYSDDFEDGQPVQWEMAPALPDQSFVPTALTAVDDGSGNTYIQSTGPWWLDENHVPPGAGWLYLTLFGYTARLLGEKPLDLAGATFSFSFQASADFVMPADAKLYFWFQSYDPAISRYVNYLYSAYDFGSNVQVGQFVQESITLSTDDADWTALYSNSFRTDNYGKSATIADALALSPIDFGVFIFTPTDPSASPASGSLFYDDITITQGMTRTFREFGSASEVHVIHPDVAVLNDNASDFGGGSLIVTFADGGASDDQLSIENQGYGTDQIAFDGINVFYQNVLIGIKSGGVNGAPLVVNFNTNAGESAVEALLNAVTYQTLSNGSVERQIDIVVSDGNGGESDPLTMTVDVIRSILGTSGDDVLVGSGTDTMIGLAGNDWYSVNGANDRVVEDVSGGNDRVFASVSYALAPGQEIEKLTTADNYGTSPLVLTGNEFTNVIFGNAGTNILKGGGGTAADSLAGLAGNDWYYVNHTGDYVTEAAGQGTADRVLTTVNYTLPIGQQIEILSTADNFGTMPLILTGNEFANAIYGNAGSNIIAGGGGTAADTLAGFAGDDWYYVNHQGDYVVEAAGAGTADRVLASVNYTLPAGQEIEILSTSNSSGTAPLSLTGNEFANTIAGNAGDNRLSGGGGNPADTLAGYEGSDWYFVNHSGDYVIEAIGAGAADRVLASVNYTLVGGQEIEILSTAENFGTMPLILTGNEFANAIYGNAGNNILNGGGGTAADSLAGLAGNDWYYVNHTGDHVTEAAGQGTADRVLAAVNYTLPAGQHIEILSTAHNLDTTPLNLSGNDLANAIYGNSGNNTLSGGGGNDTLIGMGGHDTFVFRAPIGGSSGVVTISDFGASADDVIALDDLITSIGSTGILAANAFHSGAGLNAATTATDRIIYDTSSGALYYDSDGLGGSASVKFAILAGHPGGVDHTDFLIV